MITLARSADCEADGAVCTSDGRALSSGAAAIVIGPGERNTAPRGTPAIGGTAQVGEELTASTSGISDADGLDNASFGYQWTRTDTDIQGATGSTYTAVDADEGKRLKVRVGFTDDAGNQKNPAGPRAEQAGSRRAASILPLCGYVDPWLAPPAARLRLCPAPRRRRWLH